MNSQTPLELAIEAAGGLPELAEKLGVKAPSIYGWRKSGIPKDRIADVARVTGLSPLEIDPDHVGEIVELLKTA